MVKLTLIIEFPGTDYRRYLEPILEERAAAGDRLLLCLPSRIYQPLVPSINQEKQAIKCLEIHEGCLCCNPNDMVADILEASTAEADYDRIIVVSSGFFISEQVLQAQQSGQFAGKISFDPTVAVLDLAFLAGLPALWPPGVVWLITLGHRLLLIHTDVPRAQKEKLLAKIADIKGENPYTLLDSTAEVFRC